MTRCSRFSGSGALALVSAIGFSPVSTVRAQSVAVQLPTVSVFSVQTSVVVPDSGGAYVDRLVHSARRRAYQNRRFLTRMPGSRTSRSTTATMDVAARLHDLTKAYGFHRSTSLSRLGLPNVAGRTNGHWTYHRRSTSAQHIRKRSYVLLGSR